MLPDISDDLLLDWFDTEEKEMDGRKLVLPLPDSLNRWPKHAMAEHHAKRLYQRKVWVLACSQAKPSHDPPAKMRITATLYLRNKRDEDNAKGSLKWLIDALKRNQKGNIDWRQGVATEKGFYVDDDPAHLSVAEPTQYIDRKNPRIEIELEAA